MTNPEEAAATMAAATAFMSPADIRQHCIGLAELVAHFDNGLAALHRLSGLPYAGVEADLPDVYGLVTLCEDSADG